MTRSITSRFVAVVSLLIAGAAAAAQQSAPATPLAELPLIDVSGYGKLLEEHRGKPLMIYFWASWCEPCRVEFAIVNELAAKYAAKEMVILGVSLDEDGELNLMRRFLQRHVPRFPNYRKQPGIHAPFYSSVEPKWKGAIPASFFYDREGKLQASLIGEQKREAFEKAITDLLNRARPVVGGRGEN